MIPQYQNFVLHETVKHMSLNPCLDSRTLRSLLQRAYPGRVHINKHAMYNARIRTNLLNRKFIEEGKDITSYNFENEIGELNLLKSLKVHAIYLHHF